ncbi:hypothetical protein BDY21DRAFT_421459 [Lineolata rhizophorae]|uniref:Fungal N-terminal domain-containing protein n=1 Tax=Lineolata rhizophorae TaxID=578093 RepID=A0A6A6P0F9_9PEZI|nr:hypothetical protein BDY21DRAFT_421459 [Lineolata rhizophorae]
MAEAVALVFSCLQVATELVNLSRKLRKCCKTLKYARQETKEVAEETYIFASILRDFSKTIKKCSSRSPEWGQQSDKARLARRLVVTSNETVNNLKSLLSDVQDIHPIYTPETLPRYLAHLRWLFKKSSVKFFLARLSSIKVTITLFVNIQALNELMSRQCAGEAISQDDRSEIKLLLYFVKTSERRLSRHINEVKKLEYRSGTHATEELVGRSDELAQLESSIKRVVEAEVRTARAELQKTQSQQQHTRPVRQGASVSDRRMISSRSSGTADISSPLDESPTSDDNHESVAPTIRSSLSEVSTRASVGSERPPDERHANHRDRSLSPSTPCVYSPAPMSPDGADTVVVTTIAGRRSSRPENSPTHNRRTSFAREYRDNHSDILGPPERVFDPHNKRDGSEEHRRHIQGVGPPRRWPSREQYRNDSTSDTLLAPQHQPKTDDAQSSGNISPSRRPHVQSPDTSGHPPKRGSGSHARRPSHTQSISSASQTDSDRSDSHKSRASLNTTATSSERGQPSGSIWGARLPGEKRTRPTIHKTSSDDLE